MRQTEGVKDKQAKQTQHRGGITASLTLVSERRALSKVALRYPVAMAEEGGEEDAAPVTGLDAVVVPHLEYHAVPVLLLTDEDDLTEDDVRDKLRVCFEESEDLKQHEQPTRARARRTSSPSIVC